MRQSGQARCYSDGVGQLSCRAGGRPTWEAGGLGEGVGEDLGSIVARASERRISHVSLLTWHSRRRHLDSHSLWPQVANRAKGGGSTQLSLATPPPLLPAITAFHQACCVKFAVAENLLIVEHEPTCLFFTAEGARRLSSFFEVGR